jgi:acetylornithine deacetylase/succinyl-diaminopimelate desuccinylase-like protein
LTELLEDTSGVEFEIDYMAESNSSPFETDFTRRIRAATARVLERDDVRWVPAVSTGFTDSRFTRALGVETYGFAGAHPDDDPQEDRVHGTDESMGIKSLVSGAKIMLALAYDVLAAH